VILPFCTATDTLVRPSGSVASVMRKSSMAWGLNHWVSLDWGA
jgi:hypothetical protein